MRLNILSYLFPVTLLCMPCATVSGQVDWAGLHGHADSLKNLIATGQLTDKEKIGVYHEIVGVYSGFEMDSIPVYAEKALELARKLGDYDEEVKCYTHFGVAYSFTGKFEEGVRYLQMAIDVARSRGNKIAEANATSLLGFSYGQQGKYSSSIECFLKTRAIFEEVGSDTGILIASTNVAEVYRKIGRTDTALEYLEKSSALYEKLKQQKGDDFWKLTHLYNEYAANYLAVGDIEKAAEYAHLSDSLNDGGLVVNKCLVKCMLADIYLRKGEYDRALGYAREALAQTEVLNDVTLHINTRKIFSDIYLASGRYPEAQEYALGALAVDSTNIDESRAAAANLVLANIGMGDGAAAVRYFRLYRDLNERYADKSFHTAVSDLSVRYETEKKEMRIADLERQKLFSLLIGIAGALLALTLGVLLWQKVRSVQKEKQLIATRSVLDGEMRERTRLARDLHDRLSGSLSAVKIGLDDNVGSLHGLSQKLDGCLEEIRRVAHNLMPVSLRFGIRVALEDFVKQVPGVRFHFFGQERRFDETKEFVLYCCGAELVNNSLRHSGARTINLQLVMHPRHVTLTVQDDGCGFDEKKVSGGLGLGSIRDRVASCRGKIDISTAPGRGTETTIEIKI